MINKNKNRNKYRPIKWTTNAYKDKIPPASNKIRILHTNKRLVKLFDNNFLFNSEFLRVLRMHFN